MSVNGKVEAVARGSTPTRCASLVLKKHLNRELRWSDFEVKMFYWKTKKKKSWKGLEGLN